MTTGERIKLCRKRLGLSAEKLATMISVSPATIYRWEKGDIEKVPGHVLEPLSVVLQTSPEYLMGWTSSETEEPPLQVILSASEKQLIDGYRSLSKEGKAYMLQTLSMAQLSYPKNVSVSDLADNA